VSRELKPTICRGLGYTDAMGLCIDLFQRDKPNADTRKDGAGARAGWQESEKRTWFWIRSLTRSMGAAAVLETAAETPPTVIVVSTITPLSCLLPCHHPIHRWASSAPAIAVRRNNKGWPYSRNRSRREACDKIMSASSFFPMVVRAGGFQIGRN
jgi:hypothetical protein